MPDPDRRFWPYRPQASIVISVLIFVGLLIAFVILRKAGIWMGKDSETTVFLGMFIFSALPVILVLVDVVIERGGVFEYGGMKIDFSRVQKTGGNALAVPVNIGIRGKAITDTDTKNILEALREATSCEVIIIDLEDGCAWWETRLLVLLAGAKRLGKPHKIAFVGRHAGNDQSFQGWGYAEELFERLLKGNVEYQKNFHVAIAAARQWEMVEPVGAPDLLNVAGGAPAPTWMSPTGLATQHTWMAFDDVTGLPNELLAEQLLASELGREIESQGRAIKISLSRLERLFWTVLHKEHIDMSWPEERQIETFFEGKSEYMAITRNGSYLTLVSRVAVLNDVVKKLVE